METNNPINREVVRLYDIFDGNTCIKLNVTPIRVASARALEFLHDMTLEHRYACEVGEDQKRKYKHNSTYTYTLGGVTYRRSGQHYA